MSVQRESFTSFEPAESYNYSDPGGETSCVPKQLETIRQALVEPRDLGFVMSSVESPPKQPTPTPMPSC